MTKLIENKNFAMTIKNETDNDVTFALMPGAMGTIGEIKKRYPDVQAVLADGKFYTEGDGDAAKSVTCTCKNTGTVAFFQEFFKHIPAVIRSIDMTSDAKEDFQNDIQYGIPNPFGVELLERLPLNGYLKTGQFDQNRIQADNVNIPLSAVNIQLITISAGATMTLKLTINSLR
ncbi:MAG: hypothetical protein NC324_02290 [Bacteroides sp.]|nr:hypothetical protein [Bacteroides sp.]